jgi:hypothetical protein
MSMPCSMSVGTTGTAVRFDADTPIARRRPEAMCGANSL